jgi:hypothetical protein
VLFGCWNIRLSERLPPSSAPAKLLVQVAIGATRRNGLGPYVRHFQLTPPYKAFTLAHKWIEMMIAARKTLAAILDLL